VIIVTRLNGPRFAINPDLLQRIDSVPDTILTLVDGTKYIVQESMADVITLIVDYRAAVIARSADPRANLGLHAAPDLPDDGDDAGSDPDDEPLPPPVQLHPRGI